MSSTAGVFRTVAGAAVVVVVVVETHLLTATQQLKQTSLETTLRSESGSLYADMAVLKGAWREATQGVHRRPISSMLMDHQYNVQLE